MTSSTSHGLSAKLMAGCALAAIANYAAAAVFIVAPDRPLGFDDLTLPALGAQSVVPGGYGAFAKNGADFAGFDWDSPGLIIAYNKNDGALSPLGVGYQTGVVSGNQATFNYLGATPTAVVSRGGQFIFRGAQFTSAFDLSLFGVPPLQLTVEGRLGNTTLYSAGPIILGADKPTSLTVDWAGIDRVVLTGSSSFQWVMDDFSYAVAVPEPGTSALIAAGLFVLAGVAHRKHRLARA